MRNIYLLKYFKTHLIIKSIAILITLVFLPNRVYARCDSVLIAGLKNSCEVIPNQLWRGSKPDMNSASQLLKKGVKTIINLELLDDDKGTFLAARPELNSSYLLNYYTIPDWEPWALITQKDLDYRVEFFIAIVRTAPTPIFVHCRSGQNRTGIMIAALRIFNGMPIKQAIDEMRSYGGFWSDQDAKYLYHLTPKKRAKMEQNIALYVQNLKAYSVLSCSRTGCMNSFIE